MNTGTKSVLFGVHQFLIHPMLLFIAWWKLYGFHWDHSLWVAFVVHDLGYIGKPNMDGPEGEEHPWLGAIIMTALFDYSWYLLPREPESLRDISKLGKWGRFTLLHSRYLAKKLGMQPSRLAMADKLVIAIEPSWLYLPRAIASGEINDYLEQALKADPWPHATDEPVFQALYRIWAGGESRDPGRWHRGVRAYMRIWVERHKDGAEDKMTSAERDR